MGPQRLARGVCCLALVRAHLGPTGRASCPPHHFAWPLEQSSRINTRTGCEEATLMEAVVRQAMIQRTITSAPTPSIRRMPRVLAACYCLLRLDGYAYRQSCQLYATTRVGGVVTLIIYLSTNLHHITEPIWGYYVQHENMPIHGIASGHGAMTLALLRKFNPFVLPHLLRPREIVGLSREKRLAR